MKTQVTEQTQEATKPKLTFGKKEKSLSEIRKAEEAKKKSDELKEMCKNYAEERWSKAQVAKWSLANKGLFYLPIQDEDGELLKFAVLKPVTREILDYASQKLETAGMSTFIEMIMRECWLDGDVEILEEEEFFLPAQAQINKILEGYKATLVKH